MTTSIAQRILLAGRPTVLFHTHQVTRAVLDQAIRAGKSMDLDICVDDAGQLFLGHSPEYYRKSGEKPLPSMPLDDAIASLSVSPIPVVVDCKHGDAWPAIERVIAILGPRRCLVHAFLKELRYPFADMQDQCVESQWLDASLMKALKARFPAVTTTASAHGLPNDFYQHNAKYHGLMDQIVGVLRNHDIETVCLNTADEHCFTRGLVDFFSDNGILVHLNIDKFAGDLPDGAFIGESDSLDKADSFAV